MFPTPAPTPTPARPRPRQPLAAVALTAMGGIALAEGARRMVPGADDGRLGWTAGGVFLALVVVFLARPGPWRFWPLVLAGYAALHLFHADPLPAAVLARELAPPPGRHVIRASGIVVNVPRVAASGTSEDEASAAPALARGGVKRRFLLRLASVELDHHRRWDCRATVAVEWRDGPPALHAGDRLELTALANNIAPPRNPGEFDRAGFLRLHGVRSELTVRGLADGRLTRPGSRFHPLTLARAAHDWMQDRLCLDLRDEPEVCAVVSTMLLGLRDDPGLGTLEPMFQRTGTLHFFAIDGLKLGLVAFLLWRALDTARLPRPWAGLLVLPLLFGYALTTGLGAASARAVLMAAVLVGGEWVERRSRPFNSLGGAAALLLLFDTNQLFDLGFQLSFTVVLAILTLAPSINRRLQRWFGPPELVFGIDPPWGRRTLDFLRREACALTAVALAAWLGSIPLTLLAFHVVSPISPLANVLSFPLAGAVLALGVLSLAGAAFSQTWVLWMNNANWLAAKVFIALVRAFDAQPGGSFAASSPADWHWTPAALEMVVLDVGNRARAACLRAGGEDWLLDCAQSFEYTGRVRPCLQARAVRRLDGLLLTGDDAGGLGAFTLCREDFSPARVVAPVVFPRTAVGRDTRAGWTADWVPVLPARRGNVLPLARGVSVRVFYPPDDLSGRGTSMDRALALRFDAAGWRVWWLAEGEGAAARWLAANETAETLGGTVLIATAPVAPDLLRLVHPRLTILRPSASRHEAAKPAAPLAPAETMRQEDSGAVTLEVYPERIEARGFVDGRKMTIRK